MQVRIDSLLRARRDDFPLGQQQQIRDYLTIPNEAKAKALERKEWGAKDLPDFIELWSHDGDDLVMPRGFAATLRAGIEHQGGRVEWQDDTVAPAIPLIDLAAMRYPQLRDDQERAALEILRQRQGVLVVPTGGGKTVTGLDVWRRSGITGLVCVNNIGLAQQWRERAQEHLGIEPGLIGDGVWEERPLTIAMIQTLHSRREELDRDDFWSLWGMTVFDEAHHCLAATYREVIDRVRSRILLGKTATPLDGDWRQKILLNLLGPIVHETTDADLRSAGMRVVPLVVAVKTDFKWQPTGAETKLVDSRAIYRHIIAALEQHPRRMGKIVTTIMDQPPTCAQLVLCKRLEYLERMHMRLMQAGYPKDRLFFMRGQESRERRAEISEFANEGSCVILSTVAGEGTDIPRLDRIHLTWPARKALTIIQQVGRGLRQHPDKRETIIFDYCDLEQGVLRSQFYARVNNVYKPKGWPIQNEAGKVVT